MAYNYHEAFQTPMLHPDAPEDLVSKMAATLSGEFQKRVNEVFTKAILKETGGVLPEREDLAEWCQTVIDKDGTYHLLWMAPKYELGSMADMKYCIASVPAPKIFEADSSEDTFNPDNQDQEQ